MKKLLIYLLIALTPMQLAYTRTEYTEVDQVYTELLTLLHKTPAEENYQTFVSNHKIFVQQAENLAIKYKSRKNSKPLQKVKKRSHEQLKILFAFALPTKDYESVMMMAINDWGYNGYPMMVLDKDIAKTIEFLEASEVAQVHPSISEEITQELLKLQKYLYGYKLFIDEKQLHKWGSFFAPRRTVTLTNGKIWITTYRNS